MFSSLLCCFKSTHPNDPTLSRFEGPEADSTSHSPSNVINTQSTPLAGLPSRQARLQETASEQHTEPFKELALTDEQIAAKTEKIRSKGYATVRISHATKQFLMNNDQSPTDWQEKYKWHEKNFIGSPYEKAVTETAGRLVSALNGTPSETATLVPHEFQIRHPFRNGADTWHQDKGPKKIVCLATLSGTGTEFVTPDIADRCFEPDVGITMKPKEDTDLTTSIKQAKSDRFYLFAACGLQQPDVPKLVHRSPSEPNRSIFMARWK